MSRIRIRSLTVATALIAATSLAGGTAAWASAAVRPHVQGGVTIRTNTVERYGIQGYGIQGYGIGFGSTPAAAEAAAVQDLRGNYRGCEPWGLNYDKPSGNGWLAEVSAICQVET
jgi:hypothetical protein